MASYFAGKGYQVTQSTDKYDQEKDIGIRKGPNYYTVEVKLQQLYEGINIGPGKYMSGFTVNVADGSRMYKNQLSKCLSVDKLIFVKRPSNITQSVMILEAPPVGKRHFIIYQNSIDKRIVAAFDSSSMDVIAEYNSPSLIRQFLA